MSKLFLIFSFLLIIQCQHQTVVTHYDLDGNLISEEIQQPIEDEEIQYDSFKASSDNITEQENQTQENFSSNLPNDSSLNSMVPSTDTNSLQPIQNTDEQTNFISSQFEILPVVNKQDEQESAIQQQQYQQQELERQQQLEILQANENVDWTPNKADTTYNQLDENQEEFSQVEIDTNLQPVVATDNHVLDIQQPQQQQIDINQENQQSELTQNQQFNSQEQIIQEQQAVNEVEQYEEQPVQVQQVDQSLQEQKIEEINNVTQDMPIQKQIFLPDQNQENNQQQEQYAESDNNNNSEPQMKITSNIEQDQIEVSKDIHTLSKISQDMIQSEEDTQITKEEEQKESEKSQQKPSQIEEDISFDMDDQNAQTDVAEAQENLNNNQNKPTDQELQEITQESLQSKENEELADGIKQASEIVQGNCIIIYSQCQYQGLGLEVCDSLEQIEKFKHQIKAVYIPKGYGLTIFENQNFNGKSRKYTSSQSCIQNPVSFIQLQFKQESILKIQDNLRGKK